MSKNRQPSGIKGLALTLGALTVLLTYPMGVMWALLVAQANGANRAKRFGYALGWPLVTFVRMMEKARKHLPDPAP